MSLIPVIAVVGPTASGKTRLAVDIAIKYGGEVVSADSMQIYKDMDVGTAKPSKEEMRGIRHHLIGFVEPDAAYSVAEYVKDARGAIRDIYSRGKVPVVAGGTGLYVDSLLSNIQFGETRRDEKLRVRLSEIAKEKGGGALLDMLSAFDPETASSLHPNNLGRIIRAIEVYETTGQTMSQMRKESRLVPKIYNSCLIGLDFKDRRELYDRIDKRVDSMMERGLESEAAALMVKNSGRDSTAMQAIGYKEIIYALKTGGDIPGAVDKIKLSTHHYAKRQLTWFRRHEDIHWIEASQPYEKICRNVFDVIDKSCVL